MKKNCVSQSAFFNLRVSIGVFTVLTGVFLALAGSDALSATAQGIKQAMQKGKIITSSTDPLVPVGFDCSTIHEKGIDKQENFRAGAIVIACGQNTERFDFCDIDSRAGRSVSPKTVGSSHERRGRR